MSHYWCWTLNNYDEKDEFIIRKWDTSYTVYGKEIGHSGTRHLQGYSEFYVKKRLSTVKRLHNKIHWEPRHGSQTQAIDYCKKDGEIVEMGKPMENRQGRRTDLDKIRSLALDSGMREVSAIGNLQQIMVAEKFLKYNEEPRDWKPRVLWFWGAPGVGKSKSAREYTNMDDCYTKNTPTKWWDGYDGHENIIIDDYRAGWWEPEYMLGLLDRYEFIVEYKGGTRQMRAKLICITSTYSPERIEDRWYGEHRGQLIRRIDQIVEVVPIVPEVAEG